MNRKRLMALGLAVGCCSLAGSLWAGAAPALDAKAAFEQLKSLAGTWEGSVPAAAGQPAMPIQVTYAVTSGGHAVAETLFAGTPHEMLSVYTLEGDDVYLTHYCSSGKHPKMKLDRGASRADDLVFDFASALNFDPAKDDHIHAARFTLRDGQLGHRWSHWSGGKPSADELQVSFTRRAG